MSRTIPNSHEEVNVNESRDNIFNLNEGDQNWKTNSYRQEAWENIQVFDDDQEYGPDDYGNVDQSVCVQLAQQASFVQSARKSLTQFKQLKQSYRKNKRQIKKQAIKKQSSGSEQQQYNPNDDYDEDEDESYSNSKQYSSSIKRKLIKKNSTYRNKLGSQQKQTGLPQKNRRKKGHNRQHNLKNIAHSVHNVIKNQQEASFNVLFHRFLGSNQDQNKNLKRRLYDVINVLESAQVINKKGYSIRKIRQNRKQKPKNQSTVKIQTQQTNKIQALKSSLKKQQKSLEQKKALLQNLRQKKINILKLNNRNQSWKQHMQKQNKIQFPIFFYQQTQGYKIQAKQNQITITKQSNMVDSKSKEELLKRQIDMLGCLKIKKRCKLPEVVKVYQFDKMRPHRSKVFFKDVKLGRIKNRSNRLVKATQTSKMAE